MIAYLLTALFVTVASFYVASRRSPFHHVGPMWLMLSGSIVLGALWPLLSLWAVGWCVWQAIMIACAWILGDHNKSSSKRSAGRRYHSDAVIGDVTVFTYDEAGHPVAHTVRKGF